MMSWPIRAAAGLVLAALLAVMLTSAGLAAADKIDSVSAEEHMYLLRNYRYLPGGDRPNIDVGTHLCGTRCNALAADYQTYVSAGGWYLQKIADNRQLVVELGNPFMTGQCLCEVDEFLVKVNNLYLSLPKQSP